MKQIIYLFFISFIIACGDSKQSISDIRDAYPKPPGEQECEGFFSPEFVVSVESGESVTRVLAQYRDALDNREVELTSDSSSNTFVGYPLSDAVNHIYKFKIELSSGNVVLSQDFEFRVDANCGALNTWRATLKI